ncbi:uncharacterized protein LOC62_04G006439 [Vanrija pseudolonga]|uniref:Uncharacterized protein n=1 Tax=Vanrija pseudolonga TaxID=143232 RepID=A0AAF0YFP3_9TREE|nr:hypothetical protein LOC62_04G006439 [Vanrija pseudolonga]
MAAQIQLHGRLDATPAWALGPSRPQRPFRALHAFAERCDKVQVTFALLGAGRRFGLVGAGLSTAEVHLLAEALNACTLDTLSIQIQASAEGYAALLALTLPLRSLAIHAVDARIVPAVVRLLGRNGPIGSLTLDVRMWPDDERAIATAIRRRTSHAPIRSVHPPLSGTEDLVRANLAVVRGARKAAMRALVVGWVLIHARDAATAARRGSAGSPKAGSPTAWAAAFSWSVLSARQKHPALQHRGYERLDSLPAPSAPPSPPPTSPRPPAAVLRLPAELRFRIALFAADADGVLSPEQERRLATEAADRAALAKVSWTEAERGAARDRWFWAGGM